MPLDKELSRPGAPVFGLNPSDPAIRDYLGIQSTPYIARGEMPRPTLNPNLALVRNTQQDNLYDASGNPKFGPRGFLRLLYRPTGLLYGK